MRLQGHNLKVGDSLRDYLGQNAQASEIFPSSRAPMSKFGVGSRKWSLTNIPGPPCMDVQLVPDTTQPHCPATIHRWFWHGWSTDQNLKSLRLLTHQIQSSSFHIPDSSLSAPRRTECSLPTQSADFRSSSLYWVQRGLSEISDLWYQFSFVQFAVF